MRKGIFGFGLSKLGEIILAVLALVVIVTVLMHLVNGVDITELPRRIMG